MSPPCTCRAIPLRSQEEITKFERYAKSDRIHELVGVVAKD